MKQYAVLNSETKVGTAKVEKQGLYHCISLRCAEPMRVSVTGEKGTIDLGLCVPQVTGFGVETRIPVKYLGDGDLIFRTTEQTDVFWAVYPHKPFQRLDKLRGAVFAQRDGHIGIQMSISNPTGQWSEPNTSE